MLILTRKVDQKIKIGENITITVIETRGDQVKIGIEAPKQVKVYREEVFSAIKNENKVAVQVSAKSVEDLARLIGK